MEIVVGVVPDGVGECVSPADCEVLKRPYFFGNCLSRKSFDSQSWGGTAGEELNIRAGAYQYVFDIEVRPTTLECTVFRLLIVVHVMLHAALFDTGECRNG